MCAGHRLPKGIGSGAFYASTKHAVRVLCEGLRQEARQRSVPLRVSLVSPGVVHTGFFAAMSGGDEGIVQRYRDAPGLTAADVAESVLYALSVPEHVDVNDILLRPTEQEA